ncbi:MAG: response regulator transcription factor [Sedimentisphaerales bacterium]
MATILVVEDELDMQKVVAKRLSSRGFTVHCASDGYQAVQKAHKIAPDLIVLDLQLPAGDGLSVLRKLRISKNTKKTHIVVLTGMTNELFKQSVLTEGVDAYLQKPYDSQVLLDTIDKILGKKETPAGSEVPKADASPVPDSEKKGTPEEPTLFDFAASRNQPGK